MVELLNIAEFSHQVGKPGIRTPCFLKPTVKCIWLSLLPVQVASTVGLDEPLFQPFPPQVTFQNPELFKSHEALLYLRNNDKVLLPPNKSITCMLACCIYALNDKSMLHLHCELHVDACMQVARRVKILQPDTALLSVCRLKGSSAEDKVASGMEVAYSIVYTPESTEPFSYDLVVCTEREKFLVPCTVAGSKAALDFPDSVQFPMTPAKCCASQTCLVTNVGSVDANFTLTAYPPFRVEPARAQLAAGDTMQCSLHFTPQSTGLLCCCSCMQLKHMLAGVSSGLRDLLAGPKLLLQQLSVQGITGSIVPAFRYSHWRFGDSV